MGNVLEQRGQEQLDLATEDPGARLQPLDVGHPDVSVLRQQSPLLDGFLGESKSLESVSTST